MLIDYHNKLFIATIAFEQRHAFKDAGWKWDGGLKRWVTYDPNLALHYRAFSSPAANVALEAFIGGSKGQLDLSSAEDMDIHIPVPEGLAYDPFQKPGIYYCSLRKDSLIADPPGLGKTIQGIGVSNYIPEIKTVLIVCPAHLKIHWTREWKKWDVKGLEVGRAETKTERTRVLNDDGTPATTTNGGNKFKAKSVYMWPETPVVVITYEMLPEFHDQLRARTWDLIVCDEAQYLAHETTTRTRHVLGGGVLRTKKTDTKTGKTSWRTTPTVEPLRGARRVFLSGTPILSRPSDLWALCKACDPSGLGKDWMDFVYTYCGAEEIVLGRHPNGKLKTRLLTNGATHLDVLQVKLRTAFMVRRNKEAVLKLLPPKRRKLIVLPADGLTKLVNREVSAATKVRDALAEFEGFVVRRDEPVDWASFIDQVEKPFVSYDDMEYEERAKHLAPAVSIAFEEWATVRKELASAKIKMVTEHVKNLLDTGEKIVVFTVHTEMAEALRAEFPNCAFVTGKVPPGRRQAQVDLFQNDPKCTEFIGNIVAAGTGYTMTSSRWTVFPELDFIATRVTQAEDRVWRRGQLRGCMSEHLVVEGTSDAYMVETFLKKLEIEHNALDISALPVEGTSQQLLLERAADLDFTRRPAA